MSWCGFQRDVAKKTSTYTRKNPLPKAVATVIYPVFEALTAEALLSSYLHGGTQNQNEAFNALIWQCATKEAHSSLPTVQLATYLAVGYLNDGSKTILSRKILVFNMEFILPKHEIIIIIIYLFIQDNLFSIKMLLSIKVLSNNI